MKNHVYSFNKFGIISKKKYVFDNDIVDNILIPMLPAMLVLNGYFILQDFNLSDIITHFIPGAFFSDLLFALNHVHTDILDSYKEYVLDGEHLVIPIRNGYISFHHIFTSNCNDIDDITAISSALSVTSVPLIISTVFGNKSLSKFIAYFNIVTCLAFPSHKYCHMKNHNLQIPKIWEFLIENNISLNPKTHRDHHKHHTLNYSVTAGLSDSIINVAFRLLGITRIEDNMSNIYRYAKEFKTNKIKFRFIGDIESDHTMYLKHGKLYSERDYNILCKRKRR